MLPGRLLLGVNIDHVATIRQARGTRYPDPVQAAYIAEMAGADGITVHLREDRRHIQERDVRLLRETLSTRMNLEMALTEEMVRIAEEVRPRHCCLVPEKRQELTTEGGLDVAAGLQNTADSCARLRQAGIVVSLFVDPDPRQVEAAVASGAPAIELHTGRYADATDPLLRETELVRIKAALELGLEAGLVVNAGHGLNYHNVIPIAAIPGLTELNIGHAIIARAMMTGMGEAVGEMRRLMDGARKCG